MRILWDVGILMDDGLMLRADVFLPHDQGRRYPVILSYGPYAKWLHFEDGYPDQWRSMLAAFPEIAEASTNAYQAWEVCDPERWVPEGYVCVRVDSRGCGRSPGTIDHFSARETLDLSACIEWAAMQEWSDGKVGLSGVSYYAINQWLVAGMQPPHLAAMIPWEGCADFYRDSAYHGGIPCTFWANWYDMQVKPVQHGRGDRGSRTRGGETVCGPETLTDEELASNRAEFGDDIRAHPFDDAYHRERSADWSRVTVPFLSSGNWGGHGLHLRGNVEGFVQAASEHKWLEMHGLEHWTHYYTDYGIDLQRRFFARFLKGDTDAWPDEPRVRLQVRTIDGFIDRGEKAWPIPRTEWKRLYLHPEERALLDLPPSRGAVAFEAMGEGVTFLGEPFAGDTEITGPLAARLWVSSSTDDADLFLILRLFDQAGDEVVFQGAIDPHTPLAQGWLRASHRAINEGLSTPWRPYHPHDRKEPLMPGQLYPLDIEIWPTSIVVPRGYRVALAVRGKDYEFEGTADDVELGHFKGSKMRGVAIYTHANPKHRIPDIYGGRTSLHAGPEHLAFLLLPVIPPKEE